MAALTLITRVGDVKYFICDTYANLTSQTPNWTGALCRVDDGTWYEWRQFNDDLGNGSWQIYTGSPISLTLDTGAISESNPLPVKTSLLSSTPVTICSGISATPASPIEILTRGLYTGLSLDISGTSTARTITFGVKLESTSVPKPFGGFNASLIHYTFSTTTNNETWEFAGLDKYYSIVFDIQEISGGTLTMLCRLY